MNSLLQGRIFSVGEVNGIVKELVEGSNLFTNMQVQGEVSNFKRYPFRTLLFYIKG
jgi:exodeoxyribonuclease VII large subunit